MRHEYSAGKEEVILESRALRGVALAFAAIAVAAVPGIARADVDEPSAALDRELVIEDAPPHRQVDGPGFLPGPAARRIDHVVTGELAADYGVDEENLAMTARALYTYKPLHQLRISAAGTQSGFGDEGLTAAVFSAGVGFKHGRQFSWRVTGLVKVAERADAATMETSTATTPGIDGLARLALWDGKLVTGGRIGVRFSDATTGIGAVSEVVQISKRFGLGAQLIATMTGGDTAFTAELDAAATMGKLELGLAASTPFDDLAMTVGAYVSYTFAR